MAADAWVLHDNVREFEGDGTIDWDNDSFVMRLYTSASNIATTSVSDATTATNELSTANGYTSGGTAITATWSETGGVATLDFTNASWTATGGSITARFAAVIDTTTTPDRVIAHSLLDNTPADLTATDGNNFNVNFSGSGLFTKT